LFGKNGEIKADIDLPGIVTVTAQGPRSAVAGGAEISTWTWTGSALRHNADIAGPAESIHLSPAGDRLLIFGRSGSSVTARLVEAETGREILQVEDVALPGDHDQPFDSSGSLLVIRTMNGPESKILI